MFEKLFGNKSGKKEPDRVVGEDAGGPEFDLNDVFADGDLGDDDPGTEQVHFQERYEFEGTEYYSVAEDGAVWPDEPDNAILAGDTEVEAGYVDTPVESTTSVVQEDSAAIEGTTVAAAEEFESSPVAVLAEKESGSSKSVEVINKQQGVNPKEIRDMSSFDDTLAKCISAVPECVAAGFVDLSSGMLLGVKTVDSHPQEVMDFLSAATSDLFQGSNVVAIENIFKKARGLKQDDVHYFKEIIVNSENLIHVFLRGKKDPQNVVCFVCRLSANLGMVLTKSRAQLPILEAAI